MKTFTLTTLVASAAAFKDGNPRGWDRSRRCDDDYGFDPDPRNPFDTAPCGLCDGVGGEVWGDEKNDFVATPCVPIADSTEVQPVAPAIWGGAFTVELEEIMINECDENGQNCQFPDEGGSVPAHEYVRQGGLWHMDFWRNNETNADGPQPNRILIEYDYAFSSTEPPIAILDTGANDVFHYPGRPIMNLPKEMFVVSYDAVPFIGDLCICIGLNKAGPITPDHMLANPDEITSIDTAYPVSFLRNVYFYFFV